MDAVTQRQIEEAVTQRQIEEAVLEILRSADMEEMTEFKVRSAAANRLGIDLSRPDRKLFVRGVVESFLASHQEEEAAAETDEASHAADAPQEKQQEVEASAVEGEEAAEEDDDRKSRGEKEYDDDGDLIVCRLSNKRRVTIQDFRGKTLVSIREYYEKDGKQLPTSKGISLSVEQWEAFARAAPAVEGAIKRMMGSD